MSSIDLEILQGSYWEHFKKAKDLMLYLPVEDPRRKELETEIQIILEKINLIKDKNKNYVI
ncbi:MAG: hypothetical protein ABIP51_18530 [Bacteroidia bacterium]